jgi:hypothetical protein
MKRKKPIKHCRYCNDPIPDYIHGNMQYCSDEHAYAAKKDRSNNRYHQIKTPHEEIMRNEKILKEAYKLKEVYKKSITVEDLDKQKFQLEVGKVVFDGEGKKWRQVGKHLYIVNKATNQVYICISK